MCTSRSSQENPGLRPGTLVLEHGFLADARQRARAIRLGIPVTVQHPLLYTLGSVLLEGWGEQRTREIMPVRAWLEEGASLSAGTDHPVSSFNPLLSLWGMVTRGTLKAGIQGPEYAIDQYTAVQLYTAAGAQLNGESHRRGTLEPRRLADLVAFRSNPITCPIDDLPSASGPSSRWWEGEQSTIRRPCLGSRDKAYLSQLGCCSSSCSLYARKPVTRM